MDKAIIISKTDNEGLVYEDFIDSGFHRNDKEIGVFSNTKIESLWAEGIFHPQTIFRSHDPKLRTDIVSYSWICFYYLPFQIGLSFSFTSLISEFFEMTRFPLTQIMPMV